jgi:hypothetical protein
VSFAGAKRSGRGAEHSLQCGTALRIGLSCTAASPLCLHKRAISLFDLFRYTVYSIQYETSVSVIVRFAPCVGKEVAKSGGPEQKKTPTSVFRTILVLLCF